MRATARSSRAAPFEGPARAPFTARFVFDCESLGAKSLEHGADRIAVRAERRHAVAKRGDRFEELGLVAAFGEPFVDLDPNAGGVRERRQRLAAAQRGARQDALDAAGRERCGECVRLCATGVAERSQQRRTRPLRALRRFGVPDQMELHAEIARRKGIGASADEGSGRPQRAGRDRNAAKLAARPRVAQERALCFPP